MDTATVPNLRSAIIVCPCEDDQRSVWLNQALPNRTIGEYAYTIAKEKEKIVVSKTTKYGGFDGEVELVYPKKENAVIPNYIIVIGHGGTAEMFFDTNLKTEEKMFKEIVRKVNDIIEHIKVATDGEVRLQVCNGGQVVDGSALLDEIKIPRGWKASAPRGLSYIKGDGRYFDIPTKVLLNPVDLKYMRKWCNKQKDWNTTIEKTVPSQILVTQINEYKKTGKDDTPEARYKHLAIWSGADATYRKEGTQKTI